MLEPKHILSAGFFALALGAAGVWRWQDPGVGLGILVCPGTQHITRFLLGGKEGSGADLVRWHRNVYSGPGSKSLPSRKLQSGPLKMGQGLVCWDVIG